jgi:hypothetical protein
MLSNRKILILIAFILMNAAAIGQSKRHDDSTAVYPLPAITVPNSILRVEHIAIGLSGDKKHVAW